MKRRNSKQFLYPYVAAVCLAGFIVSLTASQGIFQSKAFGSAEFWLLGAGVVAGEFIRIKIPQGRETLMVTIGDPFTLALLFMFGFGPAMLAKSVATILDDVRRRQSWWKSLFNLGQFALALGLARVIAGSWIPYEPGPGSLDLQSTLIALAATLGYFLSNSALVNAAIAMSISQSPLQMIRDSFRARILHQAMLIGFTPVVIAALQQSLWLFPLLLVPIIVVYHSGTLMQRQIMLADQLRELYEATRTSHRTVATKDSVKELLERVVAMFGASKASITLFPSAGGDDALSTRLDTDRGEFTYMEAAKLDPTKGVWARAAAEDKATLVAAPIANARLEEHFTSLGITDAMVAPMRSEEAVIGIIEVANRQGNAETFTDEDLKLFETLANHASVALENARLIGELEDSLAHLTEMNQLKDDFVASVSHELRTPLTSIRGYVKTLLRPDAHFSPDETEAFLETIDRQSQRLHRLIEDLLVVSRIESASPEDDLVQEISLAELTTEVIDELRGKLDDRKVTVTLDDHIPLIETDPGKLHQILCNLIDNAVKYSPAGAPLDIEAHTQGAGVTITVRDSGPGIDEEAQEKIFERFYQVDQTATRKVGGAGLGLYICRKLAGALGGRLWLESSDASGSEFSLWIPTMGATRPTLDLAEELKRLTNLP